MQKRRRVPYRVRHRLVAAVRREGLRRGARPGRRRPGALVWREAFGALAADWAADGLWDVPYARRVIDAVAHGNTERLYGFG